jgi:hypothetical protein
MYATKTVNIRGGAGTNYNAIGKVPAGQPVQIAGPAVNGYYPLTAGGYVDAGMLSPNPVTVVIKRVPAQTAAAPTYEEKTPLPQYRAGDCAPYSRVINITGQAPQVVSGMACLQVDGTWRIVNGNGVGMQVPPPPPVAATGPQGEPVYQTEPGQPVPPGAVPVQGLPWQR